MNTGLVDDENEVWAIFEENIATVELEGQICGASENESTLILRAGPTPRNCTSRSMGVSVAVIIIIACA